MLCSLSYYVRQQEPVEISDGSILTPWVYFLIDFQEKLLQKPFLDNYSSSGSHGLVYVDRYLRDRQDPTHEHYLQVKQVKDNLVSALRVSNFFA